MNCLKYVLLSALVIVLYLPLFANSNNIQPPKPGDPFPDVVLKNMEYYKEKTAKLSSLRGKWVVLDLWTIGCRGCFKSFPKINDLQKKFERDIQFILVGQTYPGVQQIYQRFATHYSLSLPVAYDTNLFNLFRVTMVPFIIVIDPLGKFYNSFTSIDLNEETMKMLIEGRNPQPRTLHDDGFESYYPAPDSRNIRYSRLAYANPDDVPFVPEFEWPCHWSTYNKYGVVFKGVSPLILFRVAFFGKFFMDPYQKGWYDKYNPYLVLEGVDSSLVIADVATNKNLYDYTFMVGDSNISSQKLQDMIQDDLNRQFPYTITNEYRLMPYYRVTASREQKEKIRTKRGKAVSPAEQAQGITGFKLRNMPIERLFFEIYNHNQLDTLFIDETGISDHIDIDLDAIMSDRESVKEGLRKTGFEVDLQYKRLHTLVIRPRKLPGEPDGE
ncbi:MAG: TlpA family protein disulfide reductase [Chitinophagaceae bacterium]|nr:TlpA family protein disulfide reductase [Chitinophagaceae bacterium]